MHVWNRDRVHERPEQPVTPKRERAKAGTKSEGRPPTGVQGAPGDKTMRGSMLRSYTPADLLTLANASCGTLSIFACLSYIEGDRSR